MKNIRSIVPLLPAQQLMLAASIKSERQTYIQQLLFEVNGHSYNEIYSAIEKLVQCYECFRSIILYEGLKQPVWVCKDEIKPKFEKQSIELIKLHKFIDSIRVKGFDFQNEPCIRFDWIESETKSYFCITNHHILYDGWGKQFILSDFVKLIKHPSTFLPEKLSKVWYEAWVKLDQKKSLDLYKSYLLDFEDFATISQIGVGENKNQAYKLHLPASKIKNLSKELNLTGAELVNFCWSIFSAIWTQNSRIQFAVVKQNGLIEHVKNGFGMGIQTLPFQFEVNFGLSCIDQLSFFRNRERSIVEAAGVNALDSIFSQLSYDFLIAFENYPLEAGLKTVDNEFILEYSYDRSEFPLSLAITPYSDVYDFEWHYNTKFHSKEQVECLANHFINFVNCFDNFFNQTPLTLLENFFRRKETAIASNFETKTFLQTLVNNLDQNQKNIFAKVSSCFNQIVNRIWLYGDKHENSIPIICAAWYHNIEVVSVNEKETSIFIENLKEIKHPDIIFTSSDDNRFVKAVHLNRIDEIADFTKLESKIANEVALSICTSGTTGVPKVVQLSIENLCAFFHAWDSKIPWRESEVFAVIAHPAFDIGIAELMFPLWKGWKSKLISSDKLSDSIQLEKIMEEVTAFHMVPALLESWIDSSEADQKHRIVMTGGDKVPSHIQSKLNYKFSNAHLFQFYGPSECSVLVTAFENLGQYESHRFPLGSAFKHADVFSFGSLNKPIAPYQDGEIIVTGAAVGLGYANADNSDKFFVFEQNNAFRTGDFGYLNESDEIFFRGRKDSQIKINGQRIELSRIESALVQWSLIQHWVVLFNDNSIYAIAKSESSIQSLDREQLSKWLPFYAIPQFIYALDDFPLNKNGKVDNRRLLEVIHQSIDQIHKDEVLDEEIERLIVELFPSINFNFSLGWYANGLNSIDALKLSGMFKSKLKRSIDINKILSIQSFFDLQKIKEKHTDLAEEIKLIQVGEEVYSTASRLLFLSESDTQFFKSYWICSGVIISKEIQEDKIHAWITAQSGLNLAVEPKGNTYEWKVGNVQYLSYDVDSQDSFEKIVEDKFCSIDSSLFMTFFGKSANQNFLAFKIHHALIDGLGMEKIWKAILNDVQSNEINEIKLVEPKESAIKEGFWKDYLKDVIVKQLPFERKNQKTISGARINFKLNESETNKLNLLRTTYDCSLYEAGLILFSKMWYNYFKAKNQAIGLPVTIGEYSAKNYIAAMSVNILPFKIETDNPNEILKSWRNIFLERFTPFSKIAQLDQNQKNGQPFFNCTYLYHSNKEGDSGFKAIEFERTHTDYFIALDFIENEKDLIFSWEYRADLFTEKSIKELHNSVFSESKIENVNVIPSQTSIKSLWNEVIEKFANKNALIIDGKTLTYEDLNQEIINYSKSYEKSFGIKVLILERNEDSIASLLYHLIEGIPFIPVDAETSIERIRQIQQLSIHPNLSNDLINQLQYVIATSGTTGVPKLVGVTKDGYNSAVAAWRVDYGMNSSDCCLQAASFSFDVALGDIGRSFFNGASLVLLSASERKDPSCILIKIKEYNVTVFETTPLIVRWWLTDGLSLREYKSLRLLIVGSDSWKMGEIRLIHSMKHENLKILSSYGLSETTIDNSFFDSSIHDHSEYPNEMIVPIGKPMHHCRIRITDESGVPIPNGMEGFISVSGPAVGLGYFIDGNWTNIKGDIWVSADRGVEDEWGNFHFKGRSDRQVKIRGQRVELEEIENLLSTECPAPVWKIVDVEHDYSIEMAAFYCGDLKTEEIQELKRTILGKYPTYFLPSAFLKLESIPLNTNGKTDLDLLRNYALSELDKTTSISTDLDLQERLLSNYEQCFNESILADQNFFLKGKNSFDAMFFVRSWNKNSNLKMAVHQLFSAENFIQLGQLISFNEMKKETNFGPRLISKAQEAIWYHVKNGDSSLFNLPHFIEIPSEYALEKVRVAFENALKISPALFVRFHETEIGDVYEYPLEIDDYQLPVLELSSLEKFKEDAYIKVMNLSSGPAFEACVVKYQKLNYLYFNPHHIVYDGGSDAFLSQLFLQFYHDETPSIQQENIQVMNNLILDWSSYFNLDKFPEAYFHQTDTTLQPLLTFGCTDSQSELIKKLTVKFQTTQTSILAYLLSKSLHLSGIKINWISLAIDHRTSDCVGMHMRSYPFPGFNDESNPNLIIAKQKWALSQLFAAESQAVIYPENTSIDAYHQVGLIIQHPFFIEKEEKTFINQDLSRPRLPISLYVEEINELLIFRWEFDHSQISEEQINKIHYNFFKSANELVLESISSITYNPIESKQVLSNQKIDEKVKDELLQIWKRFVNKGNEEYSNFFEAGANSIKALLMLREIDKKLNIKISASDFFKKPTLRFLDEALNNKKEDLIWEINNIDSEKEIWLLPPVMGYGLIYNSLKFPFNSRVIAFNYPDTIGISECKSIQDIAQYLINERLKTHNIPKEIILIGYSMGGLVAFEIAKWFEKQKCEVKRLIILDKIAQPETGKVIDKVELNSELSEIALQISTDQNDMKRISMFLKKHIQMIEAYQQTNKLKCMIDVYYCETVLKRNDFLEWQLFTSQFVNFILVSNTSHYEIPKIWNNLQFNLE